MTHFRQVSYYSIYKKLYSMKTQKQIQQTPKQYHQFLPSKLTQIPTLVLSLDSKQDIRNIITDYVLHHIEQQNHGIPKRRFKSKYIKYPTINLKVNINRQDKDINFQFVQFLAKYIEIEKKNIYRQERIQPLVVDILNFLDEVEQKTKGVTFQIQNIQNIKKMQQEVLKLIIQKHHKDKQKKCYHVDIDEYKKKVVAKHARISYIDIQDHLKKKQKQFLLEISTLDTLGIKADLQNNGNIILPVSTPSNIFQQLDRLIDSGELFENPKKIQSLKKQKILGFYESNEAQYLSYEALIADELQGFSWNSSEKREGKNKFNNECAEILKDWVIDIGLSQKYYQVKFGKNQKKKMKDLDLDKKVIQNMGLI